MTDKEKVIEFILKLNRNADNRVLWTTDCYNLIEDVSPEQVVNILISLKTDGYITFTTSNLTTHTAIPMYLKPEIIHYFENKKEKKINKRLKTAKWVAPLAISVLALIVSAFALFRELN